MTIKFKEVLNNKFWIVEDEGTNVGTVSFNDEQYMLSDASGTHFLKKADLKEKFGKELAWEKLDIKEIRVREVHGFPTSCDPYNPVFDVQQKVALFTKSEKSKSLYCAGYFIIKFDKGWVKSFCPKLITVERYETKGPFRTDMEMKLVLSNVPK